VVTDVIFLKEFGWKAGLEYPWTIGRLLFLFRSGGHGLEAPSTDGSDYH